MPRDGQNLSSNASKGTRDCFFLKILLKNWNHQTSRMFRLVSKVSARWSKIKIGVVAHICNPSARITVLGGRDSQSCLLSSWLVRVD